MTLSGLETTLLAVFLLLLMFGMGATLSRESFAAVLRRPGPLVIGLASQFGWMPLAAFGIGLALGLPPNVAVGLVVMGCSSGGTSSNFFAYVARADLALSISMTVVSTIVGVVAIPLVLALYTQPFTSADLAIPYGRVASTLLAMLVPVSAGIFLRSRSQKWARRAEKGGSVSGWLVLLLVLVGSTLRQGGVLFEIPGSTYLAATLLGPVGFALGWLGAKLLRLPDAQRRSVALETGIQNAPLAIGIVVLSFPDSVAPEVLTAPLLYGVIVVPFSAALALAFRRRPPA